MITLASGDTLQATIQSAGNIGVEVWGEQIPNGGGPPTAYNVAVGIAAAGWTGIAAAASGFQLLLNTIHVFNYAGTANGVSVQVYPAVTGGWITPAVAGFVGGAGNGYLTVPGYGMAIHSRQGWRVLSQFGKAQRAGPYRGMIQPGANYTANPWDLIANGTAGVTITLPATAMHGDKVAVFNYNSTVPVNISPGSLRIYIDGFQGVGGQAITQAGNSFREWVFDGNTAVWLAEGSNLRKASGSYTYSLGAGQNYPSISAAQCNLSTIAYGFMSAWPNASWAGFSINASQWNSGAITLAISTSAAQTCTIYWIAWGT